MTFLAAPFKPRQFYELGVVLIVAAGFAYANHFIEDDAFIAFRYAGHFARGIGLVWEPGSMEYGYTSFLFTLLVGLLMKTGFSAEMAAFCLSVPAYLGAVAMTFFIGRRISESMAVPVIASLALATHSTFSAYATSGLETSVQVFFVLAAYQQLLRWHQSPRLGPLISIAFFSTAALLTRLDSALLLFPSYAFFSLALAKKWGITPPQTLAAAFAIVVYPPVLVVVVVLAFCAATYGYALPNTFYIKIDDRWWIGEGADYLLSYLKAQHYVPVSLLIGGLILSVWDNSRRRWAYRLLIFLPIGVWLLYLLKIGGDFMEFRMLVPVLPFFYLLVCSLFMEGAQYVAIRATALIAVIAFGNYQQKDYFVWMDPAQIESTRLLNYWVAGRPANWTDSGKALHELFYTGKPDDVKIATTAAGALPYYADLPTLDQLGLNTRDVAQMVPLTNSRPGHRFHADSAFMRSHGVNLVVDHPQYYCQKKGVFRCVALPVLPMPYYGDEKEKLYLPLGNQCYLLTYYMNPHPAIDALVAQGKILTPKDIDGKLSCPER